VPREPVGGPVRFADVDESTARTMLDESIGGLRGRVPLLAADRTLSQRQARGFVTAAVVLGLGLLIVTTLSLVAVFALATVAYTLVMTYRLLLFKRTLRDTTLLNVTDEEARALDADSLPAYTVLVPAYREPEVINQLLNYIDGFDYPPDKLDVKLLLEADDELTLDAVRRATTGPHVEVVLVPAADPRTKPKACNYGLQIARGEYVTIYDAEDRPEPLQLRRAVAAFRDLGPEVACLQARLGYYNGPQNIITKWFDLEYIAWFRHLLPGLVSLGAPVPLGGTSNHIRRSALVAVGAWDAYNVTEDADLGIRLHRLGYEVAVLDSVTLEEANSDFVNWAKQRSRWYKGYLQTWLVHMRHPLTLSRNLGWRGFVGFNLFVGGTPVLALLNPFFWTLSVLYFLSGSAFIESLFPAPVYYPALACFVIGNSAVVYMNLMTARIANRPDLVVCALLSPIYWVMMSIAATKAALQLIRDPSFWEKTTHGLGVEAPVADVVG
jgi:cellulose synthase/poly-beta-1,6-N-acetylglucosamine synthase-like glycosyltransferase